MDFINKTDEELFAIAKNESPTSSIWFGAITEQQRRQIEELKNPHWSTVPSFWLLVISVILLFLTLGVILFGLPQVQKFFLPNLQLQNESIQLQSKEPKQQKPLLNSHKR